MELDVIMLYLNECNITQVLYHIYVNEASDHQKIDKIEHDIYYACSVSNVFYYQAKGK